MLQNYVKEVEPYLEDPVAYPKIQVVNSEYHRIIRRALYVFIPVAIDWTCILSLDDIGMFDVIKLTTHCRITRMVDCRCSCTCSTTFLTTAWRSMVYCIPRLAGCQTGHSFMPAPQHRYAALSLSFLSGMEAPYQS